MPKTFAIMMLETTVTRYYIHAWPEESPFDAEMRLRGYSPEAREQVEHEVVHTSNPTIEVARVEGGDS